MTGILKLDEPWPEIPVGISDNTAGSLISLAYRGWSLKFPSFDLFPYYETFIAGQYGALEIRKGDKVLDAGAGIGDFSLVASEAAGPSGLVVSLEPDPYYFSILLHNLRNNRVKNCLPRSIALSNISGTGTASLNLLHSTRQIETQTANPVDLSREIGASSFDVVKMDIEGAEETVFRDPSWLKGVHDLAIETHGDTFRLVVSTLKESGFRLSIYDTRDMVASIVKFALLHPFEFARAEGASGALGFRTAIQTVMNRTGGPKIASGSGSPLRIVVAKREPL